MLISFVTMVHAAVSFMGTSSEMLEGSWKKVDRLMFGDEGFNFGRYPADRPVNLYCCFAIYRKEWAVDCAALARVLSE